MFSSGVLWIFRLLHILSGAFWFGAIIFLARFIFPSAKALGPAAGPFMDQLTRVHKMPQAMMGAAFVTVLSGLGLYWHDTMGFRADMMRSPTIMMFGTGGVLAIIAVVIGVTVNRPVADRMAALGAAIHAQGGPPSAEQKAEMQGLQRRLGTAIHAVAGLVVLAAAAMAVARYVG